MNTLIIYDTNGTIFSQMSGNVAEPIGIPFLWVDIPERMIVTSIDVSVTPNIPIFEELPKTNMEIAEERLTYAEEAINMLMMS